MSGPGDADPVGTTPLAKQDATVAGPGDSQPTGPGPSGRTFLRANLAALAVAAALFAFVSFVAPEHRERASAPSATPFAGATWDDGLAEVSRYAATRVVYGRAQSYEMIQVVVKEPFDPATRTKPVLSGVEGPDRPRARVLDAMKLMQVHDVPTHKAYRYRQTLAVRVARAEPARLLDASVTSMEWCGNTFALVVPRGGALLRHVHSYFDGEGDRDDELPPSTWLEDQLPLTLRAIDLAAPRDVSLLPSIVGNRQPKTAPAPATIALEGEDEIAGRRASRIAIKAGDRASMIWLARDGARELLRFAASDGRKLELRSVERMAYWLDPK